MQAQVKITVLVEDTAHRRGVLAEHGLAFLVETRGTRVLFDTGQGHVLPANSRRLGAALDGLDAIVLSHGHYDHTGAVTRVLRRAPGAVVYMHPAALAPKYACPPDGPPRAIGIHGFGQAEIAAGARDLIWTKAPTEIRPGVHVTGEIPRQTAFEDTGGDFYLDESGTKPDPLVDDQALFVSSAEGLVVLLGCAHAGTVNTLAHVMLLAGTSRVRAVLGGMHLGRASAARIQATGDALAACEAETIGPAHCTGIRATSALWTRFPDRCVECVVGSRFTFG